jgi:hypothetical protein
VDDGSIFYAIMCFITANKGTLALWGTTYSLFGFEDVRACHYVAVPIIFILCFAVADKYIH